MLHFLQSWLDKIRRRDRVYYFFHIPKTAGTSLKAMVGAKFAPGKVCPAPYIAPLMALPPEQVRQFRCFWGHFYNLIYHVVPGPLTTFTFLRDPIERSLSHYHQILRAKDHYYHAKAHRQGSLQAFLEDPETLPMLANFQARCLVWDPDPRALALGFSQKELDAYAVERHVESDMLTHLSPAELLAQAKKRLDSFAFVGLTERFEESLAILCRRFGWGAPPATRRDNAAPQRSGWANLSAREQALLKELTAVDQQLYAYASRRLGLPALARVA